MKASCFLLTLIEEGKITSYIYVVCFATLKATPLYVDAKMDIEFQLLFQKCYFPIEMSLDKWTNEFHSLIAEKNKTGLELEHKDFHENVLNLQNAIFYFSVIN